MLGNKYTVFFYLCLLSMAVSPKTYSSPSSNVRKLTITKIVSNLKGNETSMFFFADYYSDTEPPFVLNASTQLEKEIDIDQPTLLFDARTSVPYLIFPGEEVCVKKGEAGNLTLELKDNPQRNNELNFFVYLNVQKPNHIRQNISTLLMTPSSNAKPASVDFKRLRESEEKSYKQCMQLLDEYAAKHDISTWFYFFCKNAFFYRKISNLYSILNFPKIKISNADTTGIVDAPGVFACDSCLSNLYYKTAAYGYQRFMARIYKGQPDYFAMLYNMTGKLFEKKTKDYLLFLLLKEHITKRNKNIEKYLTEFTNESSDTRYKEYLLNTINDLKYYETNNQKNSEIWGVDKRQYSWEDLLKRFRGNVIYLSFWASWCVPCRVMMPYSRKLEDSLSGKNVVFLYISIDENRSAWFNAANKERLKESFSFIVAGFKNSELKKRFKLESIPRHMIIDSEGQIIEEDAPEPDADSLKRIIADLIK